MTAPQIVGGASKPRITPTDEETIMKEWTATTGFEAGMEVTSYLPAELDRT